MIADYCTFGPDRVYVLMAIARKKDNEHITTNTEIVFREVLKDENDCRRKRARLEAQARDYTADEQDDLTFRLYVSVNARDTISAYYNYKQRMDEWSEKLYYGDDAMLPKLKRVDREWLSELQRPHNSADNYFMFDLDDVPQDDMQNFKDEIPTDVRVTSETPNGYHIVSGPFNYTRWRGPAPYELKTDGLLHVGTV